MGDVDNSADVKVVREVFLDMLADCKWTIDYDGDQDSSGRMVDCSTFKITGSYGALQAFCKVIGLEATQDVSLLDVLNKAIETTS